MARKAITPKKEIFRFTSPEAQSVLLVGDFTEWQKKAVPMQKGQDGTWRAAVVLAPGKHAYRFIVDGTWSDDPECAARIPNPFGTHDMLRQVV
jgi:1,4-alpha-glucan branching enzyme